MNFDCNIFVAVLLNRYFRLVTSYGIIPQRNYFVSQWLYEFRQSNNKNSLIVVVNMGLKKDEIAC